MTKPFPGDGFSDDELSPEERAAHREMFHKLSDAWPSIRSISDVFKGGSSIVKMVGVLTALGGAIAYLVKQGFFV